MAITLRSRREIELMGRAGAVVADVLSKLKEVADPGITTAELDAIALEMTAEAGAQALFKGVRTPYSQIPFPGAICASINDEVVHGIPSQNAALSDGDILSVDFGVKLDGYCADAAITMAIGDISHERRRLMDVTRRVLETAIARSAPAVKWSQVAAEMQRCAEEAGFSVVRDFVAPSGSKKRGEPVRVLLLASPARVRARDAGPLTLCS